MNQKKGNGAALTVWDHAKGMLNKYSANIKSIAPTGTDAKRIQATVFEAIRREPKLQRCFQTEDGFTALINSVMLSAQYGLPPDGVHAAITPRRFGHVAGAIFMPMWQGLVSVAYRSGLVQDVRARVVYEKDLFDFEDGRDWKLTHTRHVGGDPGKVIAAWCIVTLTNGGQIPEVVYEYEVERVMRSSGSVENGTAKPGSVWDTWADEMWRKTAVKRALKFAPVDDNMRQLIHVDGLGEAGLSQTDKTIDLDPSDFEVSPGPGAPEVDQDAVADMVGEAASRGGGRQSRVVKPQENGQGRSQSADKGEGGGGASGQGAADSGPSGEPDRHCEGCGAVGVELVDGQYCSSCLPEPPDDEPEPTGNGGQRTLLDP